MSDNILKYIIWVLGVLRDIIWVVGDLFWVVGGGFRCNLGGRGSLEM